MSVLSDKWIKKMAKSKKIISPFVPKQTRKGKNEGAEEINQKELQVQDGNQSMGWFSHNINSEVCSIMWPVWCHQ